MTLSLHRFRLLMGCVLLLLVLNGIQSFLLIDAGSQQSEQARAAIAKQRVLDDANGRAIEIKSAENDAE